MIIGQVQLTIFGIEGSERCECVRNYSQSFRVFHLDFISLPLDDLFTIGIAIYNDYRRLMLNCFLLSLVSFSNQFDRIVCVGCESTTKAG